MNTFGQTLKMTLFGESHGEALGIVIDGIKPGLVIDYDNLNALLTKRRPKSIYSTSRSEPDDFEVISGVFEGKTTGAPITFLIRNQNTISKDYDSLRYTPRPSHADYPAYIKYQGFNDPRGGGIFSGRLTALMMIAGALSKQILNEKNIFIGSHILSIQNTIDDSFNLTDISKETIQKLETLDFPILNEKIEESMKKVILSAKEDENSVGGIVESAIINLPSGIGEPLALSLESHLSSLLFSVPSIKGVEFGLGFDITRKTGKEVNDEYTIENGKIKTITNNNGGILGGITTGMPVVLRVAVKPTPSIGKAQSSINLLKNITETLEIKGRHDPAIVNRVVHVINAILYFGILDYILTSTNKDWMK
jgi:chorismate synthase